VVVPGGGLTADGLPPAWVRRRLQEAAKIYSERVRGGQKVIVVLLSAGTTHKPMPRDAVSGFQIYEAEANARCLIREFHVPAEDVYEENWSLDTIANAFFLRTTHTDMAGWNRLLVVNNEFHMPRTREIFNKVFALEPLQNGPYSLEYAEVPDEGVAPDVLEGRKAREAKSLASFRKTTAGMTTMQQMHAFLFEDHLAYASKRLLKDRERVDPVVAGSYSQSSPSSPRTHGSLNRAAVLAWSLGLTKGRRQRTSRRAADRLRIAGRHLVDEEGRIVLPRGINFSGLSKVPRVPEGATHLGGPSFYEHREVSFVGRPCPLERLEEHLNRLRGWGFTLLRLVITWEAVEHAGVGEYDLEYLQYLKEVCSRAGEKGFWVIIDPHQDCWSRWTGGDGAPGWTLE
ncbi:unnamed protein product, partial [Effrenium voratum]